MDDYDDFDIFTSDSAEVKSGGKEGELDPYDSRPQEDAARRWIAYALLALLFVIVLALFTSFWVITANQWENMDSIYEGLLDIAQILLSPVIALVSAATGFYYGNKR